MEKGTQSHGEEPDLEAFYFDMMAEMDFTKHLGGDAATQDLVKHCQIQEESYVLDVGCGVGFTPVNLAKRIGCRIVGVDNHAGMIQKAEARVDRQGVSDRIEFRVTDARELPFGDNTFDVVIVESVLAFIPEKKPIMDELVRVLRVNGRLGVTEATWIQEPTEHLLNLLSGSIGPKLDIQKIEEWKALIEDAGLMDVIAEVTPITARSEAIHRVRRVGWGHIVRVLWNAINVLLPRREYRALIGEALSDPKDVIEAWGYGIYVGRKSA